MKDLTRHTAVKALVDAFTLVKNNPFWLVMAAIIDALFILAYGLFTGQLRDKIVEQSVLLANQLSAVMAEKQMISNIIGNLFGPELAHMTGKLILMILLLFAIIYVIYVIFQGSTWWMALQITGNKTAYWRYVLGFAKLNLIWITGYITYRLLDIIISLRQVIIQKLAPGSADVAGTILFAALLFLAAAALFSYPTLKAKQLFKTQLSTSAPVIIILTCILLTTDFILTQFGKFPNISLIVGIVILFPVLTLLRVYLARAVQHAN